MFSYVSYLLFSGLVLSGRTVFADNFSPDYVAYNKAAFGQSPSQTFQSGDDLYSPLLQVNVWKEDKISSSGSHIFLRHDGHRSTPLILDARDLSVVYVDRQYKAITDVRIQQNFNTSYLTFYAGPIVDGHGDGFGIVMDNQYNMVYNVSVQNLTVHNDLHEFQLTGHGTALLTAYEPVRRDTTKWHGSARGVVLDGVFQEIDLETNEVLFQWRALDHIDLGDSYEPRGNKWDFFHINSIEKTKAGNYIISARHMHSIYMINGQTGQVMWTLGGKRNDFEEIPSDTKFGEPVLTMAWQHHARFYHDNENELTFFDNHVRVTNQHCTKDCSRGLHVALDFDVNPPTVRMLNEFLHPSSLQAQSQGSVQPLDGPGGHIFVGWGRCPTFTEHTADGEVVMDVQFSPWHTKENHVALDNYRAYKMDWKATPPWNPDITCAKTNGTTTLYASWNGATEVRSWAFFTSNSSHDLDGAHKIAATLPRSGFETFTHLEVHAEFARVAALDADGNIIGSTGVFDIRNEQISEQKSPITDVKSYPIPRTLRVAGGCGMLVGLVFVLWLSGRTKRLDLED